MTPVFVAAQNTHLRDKPMHTLRDLLLSHEHSARAAVVDGTQRVSYGELLQRVKRLAAALQHRGVRKGDRVAIYLERSVESVASLFAVWFIGGVAVVINDVLKTRQVNYIMQHSEASLLISRRSLLDELKVVELPAGNVLVWDEYREDADRRLVLPLLIGKDLAMLIYTSGSTGLPKGIMVTHDNLLAGAQIVSGYLGINGDDIIISVLPFSFDYGLNQLLDALYNGATLVIQRSLMPADICKTLLDQNVTGLACVPMLWQQLAHERSPFTKTRFPCLRYMTNTGGRMPEHLTRLFRKVHPDVRIYLMYGLTEAFRSTYLPPEEIDRRPTSIGKAIPNNEVLVINEHGAECRPGETGELVHRGSTVSCGYWKDPEETQKRFRVHPFGQAKGGYGETVVYSGDYVKKDEEGFLYFVGRKDQIIKSHGMRVSPEEIEDCIFASQLVRHVVAFAVERTDMESDIIAAVVPRDPHHFSPQQLMRFCKSEMPDYLRPAVIWSCDELPQTSTGKPDRLKIREEYLRQEKKTPQD